MPDEVGFFGSFSKFESAVSKKMVEPIGSYCIDTGRVRFAFSEPGDFNIPYELDQAEFRRRLSEINKALTYFHEFCHYAQYWSTTNGLLEFLSCTAEIDQFLSIVQNTDVRIPMDLHFLALTRDMSTVTPSQCQFLDYYLGLKLMRMNTGWLLGTLNPTVFGTATLSGLQEELPGIFYTAPATFVHPQIDEGYGLEGKRFALVRKSPKRNDMAGQHSGSLAFIGLHHLMECFATTVEFEHLLRFNSTEAERIIRSWIADDEALTYNLPFRMMTAVANRVWRSKSILDLPWAHLRVFLHVALMYSDFLQTDPEDLARGKARRCLGSVKTQPAITFYHVVSAFDHCSPLQDVEGDVLRLYDDLCSIVGIPPLAEMTTRLDVILEALCQPSHLARPYYESARALVAEQQRDPLLFVNDLIYPDRFARLSELIAERHFYRVSTSSWSVERQDMVNVVLEALQKFCEQLPARDYIECPIWLVLGDGTELGVRQQLCDGTGTSGPFCGECFFPRLVRRCAVVYADWAKHTSSQSAPDSGT